MPDFTEILSRKAAEVEKPKPRPAGSYLAQIQGLPKQKTVQVQGEDRLIVSFGVKAIAAQGDVDAESLSEQGQVSTWPPFNHDIWVDTPEGEYKFKQFLTQTLGIEEGQGKNARSFGEMLAESPGRQLIITLKHRPYQDKQTGQMEFATDIGGTAKV